MFGQSFKAEQRFRNTGSATSCIHGEIESMAARQEPLASVGSVLVELLPNSWTVPEVN